jgi:hypothetical protein
MLDNLYLAERTASDGFFRGERLFEYPKHREGIEHTFRPTPGVRWRLPFCHHPPFLAAPQHYNTDGMERLLPLLARGGARAMFSGHEHNFQHSRHDGVDYFVSGAGSKLRKGALDRFGAAHTVSWSDHAHFLLVTIEGSTMRLRAIGDLGDSGVQDLPRYSRAGQPVTGAIVITIER